jgi:hypothetical protein
MGAGTRYSWRNLGAGLALAALGALAASCGKNATAPTPVLTTDTLTGTVGVLGTSFKTFDVNYEFLTTDGSVTLTALTSASTGTPLDVTIGIAFGIIAFDGSCAPSSIYTAKAAKVGQPLVATQAFPGSGTYCVQVFDSGTLPEAANYTLSVQHY